MSPARRPFDTAYDRHWDDAHLAATAAAEGRIILTRDVGLLKRNTVTHGLFVRAQQPRAQLLEVVRRLQLVSQFRPFARCLACNGALVEVSKDDVAAQIPERVWHSHDQFVRCTRCGRVYWSGTHHDRLRRVVEEIQEALGTARQSVQLASACEHAP
jgi:uncharacterized protein